MERLKERHVIVCVDDDPRTLSALRRSLDSDTCEVMTTERPDQVLKWVESRDVSLVISDQRMPQRLGTDLLEEISRRSPATVRIILTCYPEEAVAVSRLAERLDALFLKPWDDPMLRSTVRDMLRDREADEVEERQRRGDREP